MVRRVSLFAALLFAAAANVWAQDPCPCVPTTNVWISTAYETWDEALSALVVAGGTPYMIAVPTGGSKFKWVVLRRITSGTAAVSPDEPSMVDTYTTMAEAALQYDTIDQSFLPKMISTIDGKSLIMHFREADPERKRAVRR